MTATRTYYLHQIARALTRGLGPKGVDLLVNELTDNGMAADTDAHTAPAPIAREQAASDVAFLGALTAEVEELRAGMRA